MTLSYNAVSEEYELTNRYLHGPAVDMILADEQISDPAQAGNTLWPLTDNLGSVRDVADYDAATDATTIANHIVYDSFGNIASETNAAIDHIFGYTGRERDEESDFYYYRRRYYNPGTGRFASEDPIGFAAGDPNLNRYVGNNSTGAVDPSGLVTGPLAGGSNVVDANGNPTGNIDCGGYVGGGGEGDYGDNCGTVEDSGYGTQWFNNDWTDWINPFAYIAAHGDSQGNRIGTGVGALAFTDLTATAAMGRLRQKRLLEEALDMDSRKDRGYFANELRQNIGNGLNELGDTGYQVADGAVASLELASEVAMLVEAGAPAAGSLARSATARLSKSAGRFPQLADDLLPTLTRDAKGRIYPSDKIRIRPEQHPIKPGETYAPRHHGQHYHVEVRKDVTKSWNNSKNIIKIKPKNYTPGQGTGFLPGEAFPGS